MKRLATANVSYSGETTSPVATCTYCQWRREIAAGQAYDATALNRDAKRHATTGVEHVVHVDRVSRSVYRLTVTPV